MLRFSALILLLSLYLTGLAYTSIPLNHGWKFHKGFQAPESEIIKVSLPHTWNDADAMFGNTDYYRGLGNYTRRIAVPDSMAGKRIFLKVGAAQTVADVFVDRKFVMQHKGGYTTFVAELTDFLTPGETHTLDIRVNNAPTMDIAPICGDFNIFGGLSRGAELIVTEDVCIDPAYFGSPGVFFTQSDVSEASARLRVEALISARQGPTDDCTVDFQLIDGGKVVAHASGLAVPDGKRVVAEVTIPDPHLWDGVKDPHLYTGRVILYRDGREIDRREEEIGFRYYHADPDKGLFLNGKPYRLNGVNRHQDRAERGSALTDEDHDEDLDIIREMGCNAVRLSHYPQSGYFLSQADRRGIVAWPEIPFVNVYVNNPAYDDNLTTQLKEMILQSYNHPSILFWGLFNEINSGWLDRPSAMVKRLHSLAHELDPSRPTMGASNQDDDFNGFTDLIAFNKYFGWYGSDMSEMGKWIDAEHRAHPERKMGISEYGAGASVYQQADSLLQPEPWGQWHPENWQTHYHMENWRQLKERDFLWCNFIWCMFDFSAAGRREGTTMGRNDKGLVTYDRKTRKDAFYLYKANWNDDDKFIHIAGKRARVRHSNPITLQAFSNSGEAELTVNGKKIGKAKPDTINVLQWDNVMLREGENTIEVRNGECSDRCTIVYAPLSGLEAAL